MSILKTARRFLQEYKRILESVSEEDVIAIIKGVGGSITAPDLSQYSPLTYLQAERKLNLLYAKGILETIYDYESLDRSYFLKIPELYHHIEARLPQTKITKQVLTDAEVIIEALRMDGQITAPILCVKANVSMDTAQNKLEALCEKDIFKKKINERGAPIFLLKNKGTFRELLDQQVKE